MKIQRFRTDLRKELEGVWVNIGDNGRLLIARMENTNYKAAIRKHGRPHWRESRTGTLSAEKQGDIVLRALAEAVLLGWENIEDDDGTPIVYSTEKAYQLLKEMRDFRELVIDLSQDVELYRSEEVEAALGN